MNIVSKIRDLFCPCDCHPKGYRGCSQCRIEPFKLHRWKTYWYWKMKIAFVKAKCFSNFEEGE